MYWSMIRMMGSLVFSAARISSRTLPSVVSCPARLTRISKTPVKFCVPAKTSSPGFLSTGSDSPVMVAWLNEPWPVTITPSAATLSPGRMRMMSPTASSLAATSSSPLAVMRRALVGRQFDQRFNGLPRALGGAGFDDFAHQHEKRDDAGGLVIARGERGDDRDADEFIDAQHPAPQVLDRGHDNGITQNDGPDHGARAGNRVGLVKQRVHDVRVEHEYDAEDRLLQMDGRVFMVMAAGGATLLAVFMVMPVMIVRFLAA